MHGNWERIEENYIQECGNKFFLENKKDDYLNNKIKSKHQGCIFAQLWQVKEIQPSQLRSRIQQGH